MAVPGSPGHKSAKQGLDLQGGLEVVLKAIPPKNQNVDPAGCRSRRTSCGTASTSSASRSPRFASRAPTRSSSSSPGVHDPRAAAALIGKTAQLEFYDLEADLTGPSKSVSGNAESGAEHLLAALRPAGAGQGQGRERVVPLRQEDEAADRRACGLEGRALQHEAGEEAQRSRRSTRRTGKKQKYAVFGVPKGTVVVSCGTDASVCPGGHGRADGDQLVPLQVRPGEQDERRSRADGRGSGALRNARRPRPEPGPRRPHGLHGRREQEVPGDHQGSLPARRPAADAAALRDRARPPDQIVAADRLHGRSLANGITRGNAPDHRHRLARRGEEPRARPPDRLAARTSSRRSRARTSPRRSARTRCSEAKQRRDRRPHRCHRSSCSSSTASWASSRCSASPSTRP